MRAQRSLDELSSTRSVMADIRPSDSEVMQEQGLPERFVVHEMIVDKLLIEADGVAIEIYPDQRLSRREVLSRASHSCLQLKSLGIEPGSFVVTCVQSYPLSVIVHLSIMMAGAVIIPCDLSQPGKVNSQMPEEAEHVLYENCQVRFSFEDSRLLRTFGRRRSWND